MCYPGPIDRMFGVLGYREVREVSRKLIQVIVVVVIAIYEGVGYCAVDPVVVFFISLSVQVEILEVFLLLRQGLVSVEGLVITNLNLQLVLH